MSDRYEMIGRRYAVTRREDGRIARRIHDALGEAGLRRQRRRGHRFI
jgi:hypothetical protein